MDRGTIVKLIRNKTGEEPYYPLPGAYGKILNMVGDCLQVAWYPHFPIILWCGIDDVIEVSTYNGRRKK